MKIYIASDHAGFELKRVLIDHLKEKGGSVEDMGAYELNPEDDYPDFIYPCAVKVGKGVAGEDFGIVIGGSGQGEAIIANKAKGVRAAVYYGGDKDIIKRSRDHNNANVLSLGARFVSIDEAKEVVDLWLSTKFENPERHVRRIGKIGKIENG